MKTLVRLTPAFVALALLAACGGANANTQAGPATATSEAAALIRGSWTCKTEHGTKAPGAVSTYSATYMSDGTAKFHGTIKGREQGKSLELDYLSRAYWAAHDKALHHTLTKLQYTRGSWGGDSTLDIGGMNIRLLEEMQADPDAQSADSEVLTLTHAELVFKDRKGGGSTACKRVET